MNELMEIGQTISSCSLLFDLSIISITMPFFRALGFLVLLITIRLMLPDVFREGEETAISFLHGAQLSADTASSIAASAGSAKGIPNGFQTFTAPPALHSNDPHVLSLPQAPSIPSY